MPVDHPVLPIGADLQLEGGDIIRFLCFLWNGTLRGDACNNFQSMEVHLLERSKKHVNIRHCFKVPKTVAKHVSNDINSRTVKKGRETGQRQDVDGRDIIRHKQKYPSSWPLFSHLRHPFSPLSLLLQINSNNLGLILMSSYTAAMIKCSSLLQILHCLCCTTVGSSPQIWLEVPSSRHNMTAHISLTLRYLKWAGQCLSRSVKQCVRLELMLELCKFSCIHLQNIHWTFSIDLLRNTLIECHYLQCI